MALFFDTYSTHGRCDENRLPHEIGRTNIFISNLLSYQKNRNSRLLGHVNFDGQNHRFVRKGNTNGFISGFGHYFPDFGYISRICVKVTVG